MPHEVPVMAIMAVVVAEHSAVVHPADQMIDVRKIVLRHLAIRHLPHFFPQFGSAPIVSSIIFCGNCGLPALFATLPSLAQMGHGMTLLLGRHGTCG